MFHYVTAKPFQEINIDQFLKDFQFETGASAVKAKEYFDIVLNRLGPKIHFLNDRTEFVYSAEDEEKSLKATLQSNKEYAEQLKQRLEEIEKAKEPKP